jgi:hypothetical protein
MTKIQHINNDRVLDLYSWQALRHQILTKSRVIF